MKHLNSFGKNYMIFFRLFLTKIYKKISIPMIFFIQNKNPHLHKKITSCLSFINKKNYKKKHKYITTEAKISKYL